MPTASQLADAARRAVANSGPKKKAAKKATRKKATKKRDNKKAAEGKLSSLASASATIAEARKLIADSERQGARSPVAKKTTKKTAKKTAKKSTADVVFTTKAKAQKAATWLASKGHGSWSPIKAGTKGYYLKNRMTSGRLTSNYSYAAGAKRAASPTKKTSRKRR